MHSGQTIRMHSGQTIRMHSGQTIRMHSGQMMYMESVYLFPSGTIAGDMTPPVYTYILVCVQGNRAYSVYLPYSGTREIPEYNRIFSDSAQRSLYHQRVSPQSGPFYQGQSVLLRTVPEHLDPETHGTHAAPTTRFYKRDHFFR